jgi:hypothetical protein
MVFARFATIRNNNKDTCMLAMVYQVEGSEHPPAQLADLLHHFRRFAVH